MSVIWVFVERADDQPRKVSLELLGRSKALGARTVALLLGSQAQALLSGLAGLADEALLLDDPRLNGCSPQAAAAALAPLIRSQDPSLLLAGATSFGCDLLPRLAVRLGAGYAPRCTALQRQGDAWQVLRPVQGGKAYAQLLASQAGTALASLRPNAYPAPAAGGELPALRRADVGARWA